MLTPIVSSCLHQSKSKSHQTCVNTGASKRRLKAFVPIPKRYLATIPRRLRPAFLEIWEHGHCRSVVMPYRLLAARLGVHYRTAQAHCYALKRLGHLDIRVRRMERFLCASNVFSFPKLQDFMSEKAHGGLTVEKQVQTLKTNTPRAVRVENHNPAMRKLHEYNGRLLRLLKKQDDRRQWRLEKARKRCARAMEAAVGTPAYYEAQYGGQTWEERNPELNAWFEREQAKQGGTR